MYAIFTRTRPQFPPCLPACDYMVTLHPENHYMSMNYDIIITGGGPIGIACALEARKAGLSYLVLEKGCLVNSLYNYPANMTFFPLRKRSRSAESPSSAIMSNPSAPKRWNTIGA